MVNEAGLITTSVHTDRLALEFRSWVTRMRTLAVLCDAIRLYQQSTSQNVKRCRRMAPSPAML